MLRRLALYSCPRLKQLATRAPQQPWLLRERAPIERLIESSGGRRGYLYFYALGAQLLAKGLIGARTTKGF